MDGPLCISQVSERHYRLFMHALNSETPVSAGHDDIVQELVGAGADVNAKNDKGITPL